MEPNEAPYPSEESLLREQPFFRAQIAEDIQEFSRHVEEAVEQRRITLPPSALSILVQLKTRHSSEAIRTLVHHFNEAESDERDLLQSFYLRGHYYLACGGDSSAARYVATEAANLALDDIRRNSDLSMVSVAMSWIKTAGEFDEASVIDHIPTVECWLTPLRRSVWKTFYMAILNGNGGIPPLGSADESFTEFIESRPRILQDMQTGGNVVPFPFGSFDTQTRINLTVADLVAILAAIAAPETLSAALAAAGIHPTSR